jgi:hypothetical protein
MRRCRLYSVPVCAAVLRGQPFEANRYRPYRINDSCGSFFAWSKSAATVPVATVLYGATHSAVESRPPVRKIIYEPLRAQVEGARDASGKEDGHDCDNGEAEEKHQRDGLS